MTKSHPEQHFLVSSALFGLAVGDALGVPVEFKSRSTLKHNPVRDMCELGIHGQTLEASSWCLLKTDSYASAVRVLADSFFVICFHN
jgi:hypothetical protein